MFFFTKARQDKARQGKARQGKARQGKLSLFIYIAHFNTRQFKVLYKNETYYEMTFKNTNLKAKIH